MQSKLLGEIIELKYGKPLPKEKRKSNGLYPAYGANGILARTDEYLSDKKSVIVGRKGSAGALTLTEEKFWPLDVTYFLNFDENKYDLKFLYYLLSKCNLTGFARGVKPGLNRSEVYSVSVNVPESLEDQMRIASLLDQADALRRRRKESIKLLDEYVQSVFLEMFEKNDHEWRCLEEATDFIDYRGKTPEKTESGVKLITAKNVKDGYLSEEPQEFIAEDNYIPWMRRGFPHTGDVLFTTEAPLGNTALLPHFDKVAFAQRVIILQPKEDLTSEFLLFALSSQKVRRDIQQRSTGSTVKGIRSKELKKVLIPIPPLSYQQKFSLIQKSVMNLKAQMSDQQNELEQQFNALMQKVFSGCL